MFNPSGVEDPDRIDTWQIVVILHGESVVADPGSRRHRHEESDYVLEVGRIGSAFVAARIGLAGERRRWRD